ncbi:MAG: S24/S26 family peptidase [Bacteroidales bacterium]|nr:S24/S26 family peptidase [Bacteroidales bacterium]
MSSTHTDSNRIVLPNAVLLGEVKRFVREGSRVTLRTKGNSMLPFIRGDKDSVELILPPKPYRKGDIALAEIRPGLFVLHRIWSIRGEDVTLMGDGNGRGKEHCRLENLVGYVDRIIRPDESGYDPNTRWMRFLAVLWRLLLPIRPYILAARHRLLRLFGKA